jgi:hypothetical protein
MSGRDGSRGARDPHQPSPGPSVLVMICKVPAGVALQTEPVHHGAGALVLRRGVGYDLLKSEPGEYVIECGASSFGRVSKTPRLPDEPPANFAMGAQRVIGPAAVTHTGIAKELARAVLDRPAGEAKVRIPASVAIKLHVAFSAADWPAEIKHHLWIGIHLRERFSMIVGPRPESQTSCEDHEVTSFRGPKSRPRLADVCMAE